MQLFTSVPLGLYNSHHDRLQRFNLNQTPTEIIRRPQVEPAPVQPSEDSAQFSKPAPKSRRKPWKKLVQRLLHPNKNTHNTIQPDQPEKKWKSALKSILHPGKKVSASKG